MKGFFGERVDALVIALTIVVQCGEPRIASFNNDAYLRETGGQYIRALARECWLFQECSRPKTRYLIWLSSVLGYTMLALPTLDIAQAVLVDIFCNTFGSGVG